MFPIIYNTNNKGITDKNNWAPCILIKRRKNQYEVLDVNGDLKVDEDIEWEGDDGLSSTWSMYYKYPSTMFVDSFRARLEMVAEKLKLMPYHQGATISVTEPQRIWLRWQVQSGQSCWLNHHNG